MKIKSLIFKFKIKFTTGAKRAELLRPYFYNIGKNCEIFTTRIGTEPYLINIHDHVNVAANVIFLNHDISTFNVSRYLGLKENLGKIGSIELCDNCFIGAHSILMPNTKVGENSIIAAGSVVTKNIPNNEVWGGCPAKKIMDVDKYATKMVELNKKYPWDKTKSNKAYKLEEYKPEEIIKMTQKFFFGESRDTHTMI
jgi:acetyltransferase-like isoleucine patch superfamily enzyme